MEANRTFEFTQKRITELLNCNIFSSGKSSIFGFGLRSIFSYNAITEKPKHLAQHDGPYYETSTVFTGTSTRVLVVTACFDSEPPSILLCVSFKKCRGGFIKTNFDLSGMGLKNPQDEKQAEAAIREIGNITRYVARPDPLKYAGILREFHDWAGIEPLSKDDSRPLPFDFLREIGHCTAA